MQKKLIALAVASLAAGSVYAQSNVTIGGWMTVNVQDWKLSSLNAARGAQKAKQEFRVDDDTNSRIWFTGKEDLGGGMDAHFYMESRFGGDNGSQTPTFGLAAGETYVGLGTPFGTFDFGRITTYYVQGIAAEMDRTLSGTELASTGFLSEVGGMEINGFGRNSNNIRYISPRLAGFQGTVAFTKNTGASEAQIPVAGTAVNDNYTKGAQWFLAANYTNGPIYLNAAYVNTKPQSTAQRSGGNQTNMMLADQEGYRLTGAYTFPFGLKVGLTWDHYKLSKLAAGTSMARLLSVVGAPTLPGAVGGGVVTNNGSVKRDAWLIPVSYKWGNHGVYFKYGQAGNLSNWTKATAANGGGGTGALFWNLAYDYALSKRTVIGASFTQIANKDNGTYHLFASGTGHNGSAAIAGEKESALQFHLTHRF